MRTSWPRCFSLTATLDAAPLLVSTSGMFSSSTPTGPFSGPNVPWTLSFAIDTNSSVSASSPGFFFQPAISTSTGSRAWLRGAEHLRRKGECL